MNVQVSRNPFGIRSNLVFMSAFLLVIPWLGYQYILEMEEYLRRGQEQTVLGTAQALATALNARPELFDEGSYEARTTARSMPILKCATTRSFIEAAIACASIARTFCASLCSIVKAPR